jgi:hypothetical protein
MYKAQVAPLHHALAPPPRMNLTWSTSAWKLNGSEAASSDSILRFSCTLSWRRPPWNSEYLTWCDDVLLRMRVRACVSKVAGYWCRRAQPSRRGWSGWSQSRSASCRDCVHTHRPPTAPAASGAPSPVLRHRALTPCSREPALMRCTQRLRISRFFSLRPR